MIRLAKIEDIQEIAKIHITSWKETYLDIVKDEILDQLSFDESFKLWSAVINDPLQKIYVYEKNQQVLGFADFYFPKQDVVGEIRALYLLKQIQGLGIGRQFIEVGFDVFRKLNFKFVEVDVFNKNHNRGFYECLGGVFVEAFDADDYGEGLKDYRYRYML